MKKNKPNQTQSNPIQTQNKAIFCTKNRPQTQNKANSNPNKPNFKSGGFALDYRSNFGYNTATFWEFAFLNSGIMKLGGTYKAE
jgi:hypothetical protein